MSLEGDFLNSLQECRRYGLRRCLLHHAPSDFCPPLVSRSAPALGISMWADPPLFKPSPRAESGGNRCKSAVRLQGLVWFGSWGDHDSLHRGSGLVARWRVWNGRVFNLVSHSLTISAGWRRKLHWNLALAAEPGTSKCKWLSGGGMSNKEEAGCPNLLYLAQAFTGL